MNRDGGQQDLFTEAPVWEEGLTGRRRLFAELYCTDKNCFLNASAAYAKAYTKGGKAPAESSVQSNAPRLMRDPKIKAAISKLLRARQNGEDRLNEFRILELLKTLAFYNPDDIINRHGGLKKELGDLGDLALCVAGIKPGRHGTEVRLYDRTKAMETLSRYLDIIRPAEGVINIDPRIYIAGKDVKGAGPAEGGGGEAGERA